MAAQSQPHRSIMRRSLDVPMSVFNKHLIEETGKVSASKDHISRAYSSGSRGRRVSKPHRRSASTSAISRHDSNRVSTQFHVRRSMSEKPPSNTNHKSRYIRPTGSELVSPKHPSCLGLPPDWNYIHDRFIAYMATHAPLENGKVPRHEERKERWKTEDIARELMERFPKLGCHVKRNMIEKRLILLDHAGDNDYFKIPYGAYTYEEWGRGI